MSKTWSVFEPRVYWAVLGNLEIVIFFYQVLCVY